MSYCAHEAKPPDLRYATANRIGSGSLAKRQQRMNKPPKKRNHDENRKVASCLQALVKAAERGDATAQFELAEAYRTGEGVPVNLTEALRWYQAAAEQGDPSAQNNLGSMFFNGMGTDPDQQVAVTWYRLAAEKGEANAQYNLALRYRDGSGVEQDDGEAVRWLEEAALQGHIEAIGELGTFHRFGRGVEQNFVAAADYHVIAALEGDVASLGNLCDYREEIEREALGGSLIAASCLAKMYHRGLSVEKNQATTFAWLEFAKRHCPASEGEADWHDELLDMHEFFSAILSTSEKKRSKKIVAELEVRRGPENSSGASASP